MIFRVREMNPREPHHRGISPRVGSVGFPRDWDLSTAEHRRQTGNVTSSRLSESNFEKNHRHGSAQTAMLTAPRAAGGGGKTIRKYLIN